MLKITDTIYGWITKLSWFCVLIVFIILVILGLMNKIPVYLRLAPDTLGNTAKIFVEALITMMAIMSSIVVALVVDHDIDQTIKVSLWRNTLAPYLRYFFTITVFNLILFIFSDQLHHLKLSESSLFLVVAFNVYAFFLVIRITQKYLDENISK